MLSRNYKVICHVVLYSTYLVIAVIATLLLTYVYMGSGARAIGPIIVCGLALLYIATVQWLLGRNYRQLVTFLLVTFYTVLPAGIVWTWGVNTPIAPLMFGLVIVLAGILTTARWALVVAGVSGAILIVTQIAQTLGWHVADTSWSNNQSSFGDVFAYCIVFSMMAVVSWLYNREMEKSLAHAQQAEAALRQQKATLRQQVKERTAELRAAQLEEMRHLYRFAELGRMGVTLLHDLANHLTALTLEVEGIKSKRGAKAIERAQAIIHYLDGVVENTRERLHGNIQPQTFDVITKVGGIITFLRYKAEKCNILIAWRPPEHEHWTFTGDRSSLGQIIAIIINNAIDAAAAFTTKNSPPQQREVVVVMQRTKTHLILRVSNWGDSITKREGLNMFKPFYSTKRSGLGLGLYIAKQTVETQFGGTIELTSKQNRIQFTITLPRTDG
jgi:signal transduction histidine kinase